MGFENEGEMAGLSIPAVRPIILIRFSYPALGGFLRKGWEDGALTKTLYERARLEARFRLFETLCLPGLHLQSDPEFTLLLLVGETLPGWACSRLEKGLSGLKDARIISMKSLQHFHAISSAFVTSIQPDEEFSLTIRLDDDDRLAFDAIARIRALAQLVFPAVLSGQSVAIGFSQGLNYRIRGSGEKNEISRAFRNTPSSAGAALLAPTSHNQNIYFFDHQKLARFCPLFLDPLAPMFLRSFHDLNDSRRDHEKQMREGPPEDLEELLQWRFGISKEELLRFKL